MLFIDEAYSLKQGPKDTYGQEAVDALIKEMEDKRESVIVILAGYQKEMQEFFKSNPGFTSRVPFSFHFADYTCGELESIGGQVLAKSQVEVDKEARTLFSTSIQFATGCCETLENCDMPAGAGNGRAVRNLIEAVFRRYARRLSARSALSAEEALLVSDFEEVLGDLAEERLGFICPTAVCARGEVGLQG